MSTRSSRSPLPRLRREAESPLAKASRDKISSASADKLLHDSNALNRAILDAVPAEIAVLDQAGIIIAVNQAWRRFAWENRARTGESSPNANVGANYLTACKDKNGQASGEGAAAYQGITGVLEGRLAQFYLEYPCDSPERQRWFSMSVTPLGMPAGGVVVAHTEITERKLAGEELLASKTKLEAALSSMGDAVFIADAKGQLIHFNDVFATFHRFRCREECPRTIAEYAGFLEAYSDSGELVPLEQWAVSRALQGESATGVEINLRRRDTGETWVGSYSYAPIRAKDGGIAGAVVTAQDITERKQSEAISQQLNAEMEQVMRFHVASQTVAAIAHELNQPLNAVSSYNEAALSLLRQGNPKPDRLQHALESSARQVHRAGQVVHELLEFVSQGNVQSEAVNLNDVVRIVIHKIGETGFGPIQSRLELEPALAPVSANHLQVEKVLINLMQNGVEAMHAAGVKPIDISLMVRTSGDGEMAQVTVCDNGPGVAAETLHRIFDPFFTTKPKGLGMGLSLSRAIIEAHGGQLWVDSEPGSGASFHFTLPFAT